MTSITRFSSRMTVLIVALAATVTLTPALASGQAPTEGILLLAHGGSAAWNDRVKSLVSEVDATQPTEVAFGMASRPTIQSAIDRLVARGVTRIVAVPLFVSSHSSVVRGTEYLLNLRTPMPADMKLFAKMNHGDGGDHANHSDASAEDNTKPIVTTVPIRITPALNRHPLVGEILAARAKALSSAPASEAVILVAHGPSPEHDNTKWLEDMAELALTVRQSASYQAVEFLTVRDDAAPEIRDRATAELRGLVSKHTSAGHKVLVVPLLMSFGGIEQGIRKRLEGLDYVMASQGLMPDQRLVTWVRESVRP